MKEFMKMIGSKGTKEILEFLDENGKVQYKHFCQFMDTHVVNKRLRQLLKFGLVEHHLTKVEKKREWYTITDKGKKVLYYLREMERIFQEDSDE